MCAAGVAFHAILHTLAHFFNYWEASTPTLRNFSNWGPSKPEYVDRAFQSWGGTTIFTGGIILWAMFLIYGAAFDHVRHVWYDRCALGAFRPVSHQRC